MTSNSRLSRFKKHKKAIELMLSDPDWRPYLYPWGKLASTLAKENKLSFPLLGYGSLVNKESAAYTLTNVDKIPVVTFGARRLFNYKMPETTKRYGPPASAKHIAALNTVVTNNPADTLNGVIIDVPVDDIKALVKREKAYDLLQVPCMYWEGGEEPFMAYILSCRTQKYKGEEITNSQIIPHYKYVKVCLEGARDFGDDFVEYWIESTYLADNITPFKSWYFDDFLRT